MRNSLFALLLMVLVGLLNAQSSRTIYVVNNCKQPYYFDVVPGAAPFNPSSLGACTSDAQCVTGSYCDAAATVCFWNTPAPDNGNYLVAAGGTNSITLPYVNNGQLIQWSGNLGFCYNASCSASESVCSQEGCSVNYGPSNIAELTMQKQDADFYDISNIGGINVAMSVGPKDISASSLVASDPYTCGTAGSVVASNSIGASSWSLTPPYIQNIYVIGTEKTCTSDADCSGSQRCGLTNVPGRTPMFEMMCGDFYGYWTANAVCAQDAQNSLSPSPFNCDKSVQNGPYEATYGGLYQCDATSGSGYSNGANSYVCGCVNWFTLTNGQVTTMTTNCTSTNPLWTEIALPHITWLKTACPSCYTYPFDDMSSTFVCSNIENSYNTLDYTVTLCPAN